MIKSILSMIKFHLFSKRKWRKKNNNNFTVLIKPIPYNLWDKIKIGNYTYGPIDIRIGNLKNAEIYIGNYCSIAPDVCFLCSIEHNIKRFSSYPYGSEGMKRLKGIQNIKINDILYNMRELENYSKGPIIIDDDVWIGLGAKIMSGVHIGQGAVIGAGAIVTKDIPPYAIALGVPAKVIKYRFSEDKIKKLLQIDYSNIPIEKFRDIYSETVKEDFDIDFILANLTSTRAIKKGTP